MTRAPTRPRSLRPSSRTPSCVSRTGRAGPPTRATAASRWRAARSWCSSTPTCASTPTRSGRFTSVFTNEPDVSAVFGAYDTQPEAPQLVSQYRNLLHHFVHSQSAGEAETFWGGCGAIRREVFLEAGRYDEWSYPRPQIEDVELGHRVRALGHRILLRPEIQCTHLKRWTLRGCRDRRLPRSRRSLDAHADPAGARDEVAHAQPAHGREAEHGARLGRRCWRCSARRSGASWMPAIWAGVAFCDRDRFSTARSTASSSARAAFCSRSRSCRCTRCTTSTTGSRCCTGGRSITCSESRCPTRRRRRMRRSASTCGHRCHRRSPSGRRSGERRDRMAVHGSLGVACPRCRGDLARGPTRSTVSAATRTFPWCWAFADFRLDPDPVDRPRGRSREGPPPRGAVRAVRRSRRWCGRTGR